MEQSINPVVSIIVPCYNQGEFLSETLDSVLSQTLENWECVIVNDGSKDNSELVAKSYCTRDARFHYYHIENSGVSTARNVGISHSCGNFILPLDADDRISPNYLERAVNYLNDNPICKLVYCRARYFGTRSDEFLLPPYSYEELRYHNIIFCTAMYRRSDYLLTSGYNPNMKKGWEDWDFYLSLLSSEDYVHKINQVLFYYRIKEQSRNVIASTHVKELCSQIQLNHPDIYSSLLYEYALCRNQMSLLLHSRIYKVCKHLSSIARFFNHQSTKK